MENQSKILTENKYIPILILFGVVIGFLNGFFGGGGGMIAVFILSYILKYSQKESQATAMLIVLPATLVSGVLYLLKGCFPAFNGLTAMGGVVAGGLLGAFILQKFSNNTLRIIFFLIMFAAGVKMLI